VSQAYQPHGQQVNVTISTTQLTEPSHPQLLIGAEQHVHAGQPAAGCQRRERSWRCSVSFYQAAVNRTAVDGSRLGQGGLQLQLRGQIM